MIPRVERLDVDRVRARYRDAVAHEWAMPDQVRASWGDVPALVAEVEALRDALDGRKP